MTNNEPKLNMTMCPAHIQKTMDAVIIGSDDDYYFHCSWKDPKGNVQYTRVFNNHPRAVAKRLRRCEI